MPGLVVNGIAEATPGLRVVNFQDDALLRLKAGEDVRQRATGAWIRAIVLHTTSGLPKDPGDPSQTVKPGIGPATNAGERINRFAWGTDHRCASAHVLVDFDGSVAQYADLAAETTFHAGPVNDRTIGVEIYQDPKDASLFQGQLDAVVLLVDWLTRRFGIQRTIPSAYEHMVTQRCASGGADVVGVYGHRDVSEAKGQGDPGDHIFASLCAAGYEVRNLAAGDDLATWRERQHDLGLADCDGVPGPTTRRALKAAGKPHGLWIARPGDQATQESNS